MSSESDDGLRSPIKCVACGGLFMPTPAVAGETKCFRCAPRTVAVPAASVADVPERKSRRRGRYEHFSMSREEGVQNMIRGGFVFVLGALVTIGTYAFVHDHGGMFVIAWGAILFGVVRFLYGVTQYFS